MESLFFRISRFPFFGHILVFSPPFSYTSLSIVVARKEKIKPIVHIPSIIFISDVVSRGSYEIVPGAQQKAKRHAINASSARWYLCFGTKNITGYIF
jgi:hypothetical protein